MDWGEFYPWQHLWSYTYWSLSTEPAVHLKQCGSKTKILKVKNKKEMVETLNRMKFFQIWRLTEGLLSIDLEILRGTSKVGVLLISIHLKCYISCCSVSLLGWSKYLFLSSIRPIISAVWVILVLGIFPWSVPQKKLQHGVISLVISNYQNCPFW